MILLLHVEHSFESRVYHLCDFNTTHLPRLHFSGIYSSRCTAKPLNKIIPTKFHSNSTWDTSNWIFLKKVDFMLHSSPTAAISSREIQKEITHVQSASCSSCTIDACNFSYSGKCWKHACLCWCHQSAVTNSSCGGENTPATSKPPGLHVAQLGVHRHDAGACHSVNLQVRLIPLYLQTIMFHVCQSLLHAWDSLSNIASKRDLTHLLQANLQDHMLHSWG